MSIDTHIESLKLKHDKIEEELHEAYVNHWPSDELTKLKKQKLLLNDEIQYYLSKVA